MQVSDAARETVSLGENTRAVSTATKFWNVSLTANHLLELKLSCPFSVFQVDIII